MEFDFRLLLWLLYAAIAGCVIFGIASVVLAALVLAGVL